MAENPKLFALLIDGDNVSAIVIRQIWNQLRKYGELRISKVFHNKATIEQWEQIASECGIEPIWVPNNTTHKNSVDIALVMDAMIILYERDEITGFCIIATDSDYTRLARHLKREGKFVLGIGEKQTPMPFRTACTQFIDIDELVQAPLDVSQVSSKQQTQTETGEIFDYEFLKLLIEAYEQLAENETPSVEQGLIQLAKLKAKMTELDPAFQLNTRLVAEKLKAFATTFPKWFEVHEQLDSKPVLHQICLPEDGSIYKFLIAYLNAVKKRNLGDDGEWVQLSAIGQLLQELFPHSYPIRYKGVARPQKVVEKMREDHPRFIELNTEEEQPKVRFRL
ncbi:MAG TPA: NYN domain-containing protein [Phototrophicaceae bacterium]|nr:NYN domain-containing protein [Phototrophicaceae bacterium]